MTSAHSIARPFSITMRSNIVPPSRRELLSTPRRYNEEQHRTALASKEALEKSGAYKKPIVTEITPFTNFYPAEDYHKDYYDNNRSQGYCMFVIDPKVKKLLKEYSDVVKDEYAR